MNHNDTLKRLLIAVAEDALSYSQLVELVKITRVFSYTYLKNYKSEAINFSGKNGIDINDLALDSIADIFERDSNNQFFNLNKFILSLDQSVKEIDAKRLYLAYYSFTVKFASIQLARIYADFDPNGTLIYKNIKETIKKFNDFEIFKNKNGTTYIVRDHAIDANKKYINCDVFEMEFLSSAQGNRNARGLLGVIHKLLCNQNDYRKEIKLIDVVRLFKAYYRYEENIIEDEDISQIADRFSLTEKAETEQLVNKVTEIIKRKIFIDYYTKGKVTPEQALGLVETINAILLDWIEVGQNGLTNYEYLSKFINVDKAEYFTSFKAKLEYLIDITKKELKFYLEKR